MASSEHGADEPSAKLLIVEDNPVNQKIAERALEKLGFRADVAGDGVEATEVALAERYALILMDCMMPRMDGFDATRAIRSGGGPNRDTPIVAFTADQTASCRERCLDAGMNDYLTKPLDLAVLQAALQRWLRS